MKPKKIYLFVQELLYGYASVLFTERAALGCLFLLGTFYSPTTGLCGLITASIALLTAKIFTFKNLTYNQQIYNAILLGLSLGVHYEFNIKLVVLCILAGFCVTWITSLAVYIFYRIAGLPVLSVPFVLMATIIHFLAKIYPLPQKENLFLPTEYPFFSAIGATLFTPHPLVGFFYFLGILWASRYLALLTVGGYVVGATVFITLVTETSIVLSWAGFTLILTSMAIGGLFTKPSRRNFIVALLGSALAGLLIVAMQGIFVSLGPLTFVLPFLISTTCVLVGLQLTTKQTF